MKFSHHAVAVSLCMLAAGAVQAATVTYAGNAVDTTRTGMGAEFSSGFDTFDYHAFTGSVDATSPVTVNLGSISFTAGYNCNSCTLTPSFTDAVDLTIDGVTKQFDFSYNWHSTGPSDYLAFSPIASLSWDLGGGDVATVTFNTPATLVNGSGTVSENLTATVTAVPEPSSAALLLAGMGLGLAGLVRRRTGAAARA